MIKKHLVTGAAERNSTLQKDKRIGQHNDVNTDMKKRVTLVIYVITSQRAETNMFVASQRSRDFCNYLTSVLGSSQDICEDDISGTKRHDTNFRTIGASFFYEQKH